MSSVLNIPSVNFTFIVSQIAIALDAWWCDRAFGWEAIARESNHRIVMVEMDKIVSEKRGWVSLFQPNLINYLMRLL